MTVLDFEKIVPVKAEPFPFTELQTKWIEALESGEYKQSRRALNDGTGFCCLGVLCEIAGMDFEKRGSYTYYSFDGQYSGQVLPDTFTSKIGLRDRYGSLKQGIAHSGTISSTLIGLNDRGVPFSEIAQLMRHDPWNVFAGPSEA